VVSSWIFESNPDGPSETTHRRLLDHRILHRWITEAQLLLQQVNPHHGLQQVRSKATFGARFGVEGLEQGAQPLPDHNCLHLSK
jgi:hypothetical protein